MSTNSLQDFRKDIEKRYMSAIEHLAEEVSFQIESAYETVIEKFYDDYSPVSYNRTYSTYLASDGYDDPFSYTQSGNVYTAGIQVSSDFIQGKPYRADTDWVFNRTFERGIHGFNKKDMDTYNVGKYGNNIWRVKHRPKNMRPAPKKLMDREFKRITKKGNMDKLFNEQLSKAFK